jgi:nucleoid DNA-binding protein
MELLREEVLKNGRKVKFYGWGSFVRRKRKFTYVKFVTGRRLKEVR